MQHSFSRLTICLLMAGCAAACAQDVPVRPTVLSSQASSAAAEFEGRYKVGATYCTVTPVKMAFEVRWAKGKGRMTFFFDQTTADGKVVFVSEALEKGRDRFVFDDAAYNAGVFIRADGRVFALERVQEE